MCGLPRVPARRPRTIGPHWATHSAGPNKSFAHPATLTFVAHAGSRFLGLVGLRVWMCGRKDTEVCVYNTVGAKTSEIAHDIGKYMHINIE